MTRHRLSEHLVDPPDEWIDAKAKLFEPAAARLADGLFACELRRILARVGKEYVEVHHGLPIPDPVIKKIPVLADLERHVHSVKARSLDHLKQLVGVPNEAVLAARRIAPIARVEPRMPARRLAVERIAALRPIDFVDPMVPKPVRVRDLPATDKINFKRLRPEQRVAVRDQAFNLVYGYADEEAVARRPLKSIRDYAVASAARLPVLRLADLVVCDGEKVSFSGYSSVWFNNVIIEGSGEIRLGQFTKLHAYQIKRV